MQLGVITDLIFQSVNGGRASTDSSITKAQIKALLPAGINYALTGDYWANMRAEGDKEVPGSFITELSVRKVQVDNRGRDYIDLPEKIVDIGGNGGIRYIQDGVGNHYSPRPQGTSPNHWDCILVDLKEHQKIGKKVYIYNRPALVEDFYPGVIQDVSALSDTDEVSIPAGRELEVIDIVKAFFKDQRMNPKDYIVNGVDPLNEITNV